jgi:hypothetical protein
MSQQNFQYFIRRIKKCYNFATSFKNIFLVFMNCLNSHRFFNDSGNYFRSFRASAYSGIIIAEKGVIRQLHIQAYLKSVQKAILSFLFTRRRYFFCKNSIRNMNPVINSFRKNKKKRFS